VSTVVRNGMTDMMSYNLAGGLLGETFSGGFNFQAAWTTGYVAGHAMAAG